MSAKPSKSQHASFKETARALGCDESEAVFDKALGKIGKATPEPKPSKRKRKPLKVAI